MVLGDIAQNKFRAAMARIDSFSDLINRPVALVIFILIMLVLLWQIMDIVKRRKS